MFSLPFAIHVKRSHGFGAKRATLCRPRHGRGIQSDHRKHWWLMEYKRGLDGRSPERLSGACYWPAGSTMMDPMAIPPRTLNPCMARFPFLSIGDWACGRCSVCTSLLIRQGSWRFIRAASRLPVWVFGAWPATNRPRTVTAFSARAGETAPGAGDSAWVEKRRRPRLPAAIGATAVDARGILGYRSWWYAWC